ncbi:MAG: hypothetical protein WBA52_12105 [Dolichospermum sp.]
MRKYQAIANFVYRYFWLKCDTYGAIANCCRKHRTTFYVHSLKPL